MTCDKCGAGVDGLQVCPACNTTVPMRRTPASVLQADEKICAFCAETIKASAVKCRYCGGALGSTASLEAGPPPYAIAARPNAGIEVSASASSGGRDQPSIIIQNVQSTAPGQRAFQAKSPGVAVVLSFFFAGLGQFYNGDIGKGLLFIVAQMINFVLMFMVVGFFTAFLTWVIGMVDAHHSAVRINARGY